MKQLLLKCRVITVTKLSLVEGCAPGKMKTDTPRHHSNEALIQQRRKDGFIAVGRKSDDFWDMSTKVNNSQVEIRNFFQKMDIDLTVRNKTAAVNLLTKN
mmetsp:Transcript_8417/g.11031  ORF Transcript_8417/g.11031 Transcript_8417/m.11031 type:complete len:100 (-) Transcript_8417:224-523(-)